MSSSSQIIANETEDYIFARQKIEKFLALMATKQVEYSDISYKGNRPFSLVLRAKKDGVVEVALKEHFSTDHANRNMYAIERELPSSEYFMAV